MALDASGGCVASTSISCEKDHAAILSQNCNLSHITTTLDGIDSESVACHVRVRDEWYGNLSILDDMILRRMGEDSFRILTDITYTNLKRFLMHGGQAVYVARALKGEFMAP